MGKIKFYKYHGAGNDFVLLDNREGTLSLSKAQIEAMCDRRFGIGADGLMLLESCEGYDFRMVYYNADGGEVAMCGNGARVIVLFAKHMGIDKEHLSFIASDGEHTAQIIADDGVKGQVVVELIDVESIKIEPSYTFMNTGVEHHVIFSDDVMSEDIVSIGRQIRYNKELYPSGTNVNFVEKLSPSRIKVRTYERGVEDETLACGTGIAASAIAFSISQGGGINSIDIEAMGGELNVSFDYQDGCYRKVMLLGPAQRVFEGYI